MELSPKSRDCMTDTVLGATAVLVINFPSYVTVTLNGRPLANKLSRTYDPSDVVVVAADCCMGPDTSTTAPAGSDRTTPESLK